MSQESAGEGEIKIIPREIERGITRGWEAGLWMLLEAALYPPVDDGACC